MRSLFPPRLSSTLRRAAGLMLVGLLITAWATSVEGADKAQQAQIEALPEKYQQFLKAVELLISDAERERFLSLEKDYQRDAFIERFWRVRDPDTRTTRNEFKDRWEALQDEIKTYPKGDERARLLLLNGPPAGQVKARCSSVLWPLEVWYYAGSDRLKSEFYLVFFQPYGGGKFRLWQPGEGLDVLFDTWVPASQRTLNEIANGCADGRTIAGVLAAILNQGTLGYSITLSKVDAKPEAPSAEWVDSFDSFSTDVDADAKTFKARVELTYPGRRQNRTVVQGLVAIPPGEVAVTALAGSRTYNLVMTGEILKDAALFESFRYKFDYPAAELAERDVPLLFERNLRPDSYVLILKVEDLASGKVFRTEMPLVVPATDTPVPPPPPEDDETARLLAEANAAVLSGETTLQLVEPRGDLLTGMVRFETLTTGREIAKVVFRLNGKEVLIDTKAPFGVELDLGELPRLHALRATAYDAGGKEVANDEALVNSTGGTRFRVRLTEPRPGKTYRGTVRAEAQVEVPAGDKLDRVEIWLNDTRLATLYGEPWAASLPLPAANELTYVRAVAFLEDGNSTEDTAFANAPAYLEELEVQLVELYATVLDRADRPVEGLAEDDFRITEDGIAQQMVRFEQVRDLPIHAGILLDVSASIEPSLLAARDAALTFFQQILKPKDRATLITFNDRPNLAVKFTKDVDQLAAGLASLKAERGTALYDSLIFSLYYFNGVKGQKALLLLSDGKDESSRFAFEDALEFARRAGVTIYAVGLSLPKGEPRRKLEKITEETGGLSFFIDSPATLPAIYAQIEKELRSQYLLAYQSSNTSTSGEFRSVEVKTAKSGLEVRTSRGYYP